MIILREIDLCEQPEQVPPDYTSPYMRRQRPDISATNVICPVPHDIKIAQPSLGDADLAVSHQLVDVDFFDTDSDASDFVDSASGIDDATNIAHPVPHDINVAQPSLNDEHSIDC
jgi:hypothetical protein